jgi:CRP-like cAMP-binding protein
MEQYYPSLQACPLFYGIEREELFRMLHCQGAIVKQYDKKQTIFAAGSPAEQLGILLSGSAQIVRDDYYGNRSLVSTVEPGELFSEDFACAEVEALPVSVLSIKPCEAMFLDCRHVLHTCSNHCSFHQQLIYNLMRELANKTLRFHRKAEITAKRTTREKLLTYLHFQAQQAGSSSFSIPLDRQGLADYLEVDRSGLSAEISKLRAEGVLRSDRKHFELL